MERRQRQQATVSLYGCGGVFDTVIRCAEEVKSKLNFRQRYTRQVVLPTVWYLAEFAFKPKATQ
jgi:hypothetical protein